MRLPARFLGFSSIKKRLDYYLNSNNNALIQHPSIAACVVKRDMFERAGGMDEAYDNLLMDADLGMRLSALGYMTLAQDAAVDFAPNDAWKKRYMLDNAPLWTLLKKLTVFSDKWGMHWW